MKILQAGLAWTMCQARDARLCCPWRHEHVRQGDFRYDWRRGGWLWAHSTSPELPWIICPGCGGTLPRLPDVVARLLESPLETWDNEE